MSDLKEDLKKPVSGIMIPMAIVLGGALIIWGVTQLLSTNTGYKDLVKELHSKTFGNKWVAAYELSKYISSQSIPEEDIPWLKEQLKSVYFESRDPRTKNFIILTLSSLKDSSGIKDVLNDALNTDDKDLLFNSVVSLGRLENSNSIDFSKLEGLLENSKDMGVKQAILLLFANHQKFPKKNTLRKYLESTDVGLRYSALTAILSSGDLSYLEMADDLFEKKDIEGLNENKLQAIKLNMLSAFGKIQKPNKELTNFIDKIASSESGLVIQTKAKSLLIKLKKL